MVRIPYRTKLRDTKHRDTKHVQFGHLLSIYGKTRKLPYPCSPVVLHQKISVKTFAVKEQIICTLQQSL